MLRVEDQSRWRKEEERLVAEISELRVQLSQDRYTNYAIKFVNIIYSFYTQIVSFVRADSTNWHFCCVLRVI